MTDRAAGARAAPSGVVSFSTNNRGELSGSPCTLSGIAGVGTCEVRYIPMVAGKHELTAAYRGDSDHAGSNGQTTLRVR